tara:strand:- start:86 stop:349 length:264 start_codon:yes stop_codon:yes gene_type:complete
MTKIYIYCVFDDEDVMHGVYSSLKSAHKDAIKLANRQGGGVYIVHDGKSMQPDLTFIRNIFKGEIDLKINYYSNKNKVTVLKTKLRD